jgi:hypothetical protein
MSVREVLVPLYFNGAKACREEPGALDSCGVCCLAHCGVRSVSESKLGAGRKDQGSNGWRTGLYVATAGS